MRQSHSESAGDVKGRLEPGASGGGVKYNILAIGAGFGGVEFCKHLHHSDARITLVDRANHHLFQPLLYQVATAGLSAPDIAQPIRSLFRHRSDITVLMDEAIDFDLTARTVFFRENIMRFDFLVLAMGGRNSYFGHPQWEHLAPGLKTLEDAVRLRSNILLAFERAENHPQKEERDKLMTIVIIGGGPTGVELAGACAELARTVLRRDFRRIDPRQARIILIEGERDVLAHFPPELSEKARKQLEALGVSVKRSCRVKEIHDGSVELENGETISARTVIWAAGVSAVDVTKQLGVELDKAGRVKVKSDLSLPGFPEVFAIGDMACVPGEDGKPVPGVAPAALQMARHVARIIGGELRGDRAAERVPFKYFDKGTLAAIGRSSAVAWRGRIHLSGYPAWLMWLFVHLIFLAGFRNRLAVMFQWFYSYVFYKRGARIIANDLTHNAVATETGRKAAGNTARSTL